MILSWVFWGKVGRTAGTAGLIFLDDDSYECLNYFLTHVFSSCKAS